MRAPRWCTITRLQSCCHGKGLDLSRRDHLCSTRGSSERKATLKTRFYGILQSSEPCESSKLKTTYGSSAMAGTAQQDLLDHQRFWMILSTQSVLQVFLSAVPKSFDIACAVVHETLPCSAFRRVKSELGQRMEPQQWLGLHSKTSWTTGVFVTI